MKKIYMAVAALLVAGASFAQTDKSTTVTDSINRVDTIKAGNFIIIKKSRNNGANRTTTNVSIERKALQTIQNQYKLVDLRFRICERR